MEKNGIFVEGELYVGRNDADPFAHPPTVTIYEVADDGIFINSSGVAEIDDATIKIGLGLFDELEIANVDFGIYNKNIFDLLGGTILIKNTFESGFCSRRGRYKNCVSGTLTISDVDHNGIEAEGGTFNVFSIYGS